MVVMVLGRAMRLNMAFGERGRLGVSVWHVSRWLLLGLE